MSPTKSQSNVVRTDTGAIDYRHYSYMARKKRADAFVEAISVIQGYLKAASRISPYRPYSDSR